MFNVPERSYVQFPNKQLVVAFAHTRIPVQHSSLLTRSTAATLPVHISGLITLQEAIKSLMYRPSVASNVRQSIASGTHGSASSRILAKKKEYDTVEGLEHNAHALRETFITFAKQMKSAQEGAQCESHTLCAHQHYYNM